MEGHKARRGALALAALAVLATPAWAHAKGRGEAALQRVGHIVVIYQENHSFDNLYGRWERVNGVHAADPAHTIQVNQAGRPYACLEQNDVNLAPPVLPGACTDTTTGRAFTSRFPNGPFRIDDYIRPDDRTCPRPGMSATFGVFNGMGEPGGCTRDLVHRFYQEQYQLAGGRQDHYLTGSDAVGLTMGTYDTRRLPVYEYLHRRGHPRYAVADRFFQAAFGGSFLNHQWLIAAATPVYPNAPAGQHSVLDSAGMPIAYDLYTPDRAVSDQPLTQQCGLATTVPRRACGDWAVNTIQPFAQPYTPGTAPERRLPLQTGATIGDRLSAKGVSWAWYSGGWSNANGDVGAPGWTNGRTPGVCTDPDTATGAVYPNCPDKLFQYHHQPFNYFASFAPGTRERVRHLRDEVEFVQRVKASRRACKLRRVSFVKPIGAENEHPGYASEHNGSDHLVDLLQGIQDSRCRRNTMVVVTYDEFGGEWDHVPPPGQGATTPGPHDEMGPGTRIPALILAPRLRDRFVVDRASHDTTAVMATIEHRFTMRPVGPRDARVQDLSTVFEARARR